MEVIVGAIGQLGTSLLDFLGQSKEAKYGRLPDWLSPTDFDNRDRTPQIILYGALAIIIVIIIAIALINRKK